MKMVLVLIIIIIIATPANILFPSVFGWNFTVKGCTQEVRRILVQKEGYRTNPKFKGCKSYCFFRAEARVNHMVLVTFGL